MQARKSIFPKNEILILLLLTFPLLSTGCQKTVWGFPVEEARARLSRADYGFLQGIDAKTQDLTQAFSLGPGAPYYLSLVFDRLKRPEIAGLLLELAWNRSPRPWKEEAGLALAGRYLEEKEYANAVKTSRALLSMADGAPAAGKARRMLVEALYWSKADAEALQEADLTEKDPELTLFRAVSSLRLSRNDARDLFLELFLREKASALHARAYLFLSDTEAMGMFSDLERNLLAAKYAFQQGDWVKGVPLMEEVVSSLGTSRLVGSTLISELGAAYISANQASRGAAFMDGLARSLTGTPMLDALEAAGKCRRRSQDYTRALENFRALASRTADPDRQDRARWFILDILLKTDPPDLMERIGKESPLWNDPSYFSDLLEGEISSLVAGHKWRDIAALRVAVEKKCSPEIAAQLAYIVARALQEGLLPSKAGGLGGTPATLFRSAMAADPLGYYGVVSACLAGELPEPLKSAADAPEVTGAAKTAGGGEPDPLIQGFISFGLGVEAFDLIWNRRGRLDDERILSYAKDLATAGDFRRSMNLIAYLGRRHALPTDEIEVLYPRAFSSLIEELAGHSPFPAFLLYGMIREESYFDADIVSGAGAVGLAQLLPSTASDVAGRLKVKDPDLTDPLTNLTLGVHYLEGLLDRVGSLPKALLSYNAGLSRARSWDRLNGSLALDLFIEAVPYDESRGYVKKILVSTVMYAYLYQKQAPRETLGLFFPNVGSLPPFAGSLTPGAAGESRP